MAEKHAFKRGDTLTLLFRYREPDGSITDITNMSFRMHVKDSSGKVVVELESPEVNGLTKDIPDGSVTAVIPAFVTKTFKVQKHYTDLEATYLDGPVLSSETVVLDVKEDYTV